MGTINYGTGDYITIAYQPIEGENSTDIEAQKWAQAAQTFDVYEDQFNCCFDVILDRGYYEGFYVEVNAGDYISFGFDDKEQVLEAYLELEQVRKFLIELLEAGLYVCHPGWCTGYLDYSESLNEINQAIAKMSDDIFLTPIDIGGV